MGLGKTNSEHFFLPLIIGMCYLTSSSPFTPCPSAKQMSFGEASQPLWKQKNIPIPILSKISMPKSAHTLVAVVAQYPLTEVLR